MGGIAKSVGDFVSSAGNLVVNTVEGTINNSIKIIDSTLKGDFDGALKGTLGLLQTAVAVTAIGIGAFFMFVPGLQGVGAMLISSGVVMLDAQHNEGRLTASAINIAAGTETAVLGTKYIEQYATEIQIIATLAATLYASYIAVPVMMDVSGMSSVVADIPNYIKQAYYAMNGAYDIYTTYSKIQNIKEYYTALLDEYARKLQELSARANASKEQWFNLFTDPDMIGRIMPGGDLYNGGAGSPYFTVTDAHEPSYLMLASETKRISDIDGIYNGQNDSLMAGGRDYMYSLGAGIKYN